MFPIDASSPFILSLFCCDKLSKLHIEGKKETTKGLLHFLDLSRPPSHAFTFHSSSLLIKLLDLLVPVSSIPLGTSTSGLSPRRLQGVFLLSNRISRLEVGFTLRCLQRLSLPDLATLLCLWSATDPPAVCPFRSSRTKNSSSQISYAHDG